MLTETGRVVAINDNSIWVETIQQSTCGQCGARKGCGQSVLHKMYDGKRHHIEIPIGEYNGVIRLDDQVEIGIPETIMLKGSLLIYLLPIVLLLIGAAIAGSNEALVSIVSEDPAAILGAVLGFGSGLLINKTLSLQNGKNSSLRPQLLKCQGKLIKIHE